jgi:hypothetical protein
MSQTTRAFGRKDKNCRIEKLPGAVLEALGISAQNSTFASPRVSENVELAPNAAAKMESALGCPQKRRSKRSPRRLSFAEAVLLAASRLADRELKKRGCLPKNQRRPRAPLVCWTLVGGVEGDRTPDLRTASAALSQLSYDPGMPVEATRLGPSKGRRNCHGF